MTKHKKSRGLTVVIIVLTVLTVIAITVLLINIVYQKYVIPGAHPIEYREIVERLSKEHNIDKYLIYAIIKTESSFNPNAESNMGARGLMQIMPETFEWIRDYRLREDSMDFDNMYNPEDNIRYGVYLISYHLGHYNNIDNSLAAYHAGNAAVDSWLRDMRYSSDGKTLHNIPFSDTEHYIYKVNKAYKTYIELYKKQ